MILLRMVPRLLALLFLAVAVLSMTGQVRFQPVLTGSMAPGIPTGTLVAVTPVTPDQLRVGEIIMFVPPRPWGTPTGGPVLHRIVAVTVTRDGRAVRTKGDANSAPDPWTLDASSGDFAQLRGSSAMAGRAVAMVRHSTSGPALAVWPGLLLLWFALRNPQRTRHRSETPKIRGRHQLRPAAKSEQGSEVAGRG